MKKYLISLGALLLMAPAAYAEDVKIGVLLGFTGPIESLTPAMAASAEMAIQEINDSGKFMNGASVSAVRADSTCLDATAATTNAERLITAEKVNAIMGADCSGATIAVLQNVALPNGVVMVSPAATSPALSTIRDDGLFFRTAPSDARQGQVAAEILKANGYLEAAVSYTNNDYGKALVDTIAAEFEKLGGEITIVAAHEDGKGDYSAEVAALAAAGGEILVVAGYLDQGGKGIIQAALDTGAFDVFYLPDGMIGDSLPRAIGPDLDGSIGSAPGTDSENSEGAASFKVLASAEGINADAPYTGGSYDAAALIVMAMQAAGSTDSSEFASKITEVANAPGTKIMPGELGKALEIIAAGGEVDYVGATDVELIGPGESAGSYQEILVDGGKNTIVRLFQNQQQSQKRDPYTDSPPDTPQARINASDAIIDTGKTIISLRFKCL